MAKLFGIDVAKLVNKYIAPGLVPATLTKRIPGARSSSTTGREATEQQYPTMGVVQDYNAFERAQGQIQLDERKILLVAARFPDGVVPAANDTITIEDETYVISGENGAVMRDPASATYTCRARR